MRLRTFLREHRGPRSIRDVCAVTGLAVGEVSMFERGHQIPRDSQIDAMLPVYGPVTGWYPPGIREVLFPDLRYCPGCNKELPTDSSRRRKYHNEACRSRARRRESSDAG